jgi:probable HAF family extracellular repeat protein
MKKNSSSRALRPLAIVTVTLCLCLAHGTRRTHAQPALVDLGTLGGDVSHSQGINAIGQVVGYSFLAGNEIQHAFLWTPDVANGTTGTMVDLGALGGNSSIAYGINDVGVVVGSSNSPDFDRHAFVWTPLAPNAVAGQMIDIGTLGGPESEARDINNSGQIVGWSFVTNPATSELETHAFLRMPGGAMVDLGTLLGPESYAMSVSEDGKVTGWCADASRVYRPFLWTPDQPNGMTGTIQDLGTLGGSRAFGHSVNSAGQVSGISERTDGNNGAFLWTPGATDGVPSNPQMRDLGAIDGFGSLAFGINDTGWVTGVSDAWGNGHPFVWIPGTPNGTTGVMIDMQTLGGSNAEAAAVNNANQIAGTSSLDGAWHAFVSVPPASDFSQTITFGALGNKVLADPDFAVSAAASSGLMVSFGAAGSCEVTGSIVHITGGGTCTITASQAGNSIFAPATAVQQSFSIDASAGPRPQTIAFAPILNKVASDPDFTVSATATSGLTVTFAAAGECTMNGTAVHLTGVGSCLVTASQAGDAVYAPAEAKRSFLITSAIVTSTLVDIGTLGGGVADPRAINASGQIVGSSYVADDSEQHAFLWTPVAPNGTTGTWTDLGTLGGTYSAAYGVNDFGFAVGVTNMPAVDGAPVGDQAFIWVTAQPNGTIGGMLPLGVLGNGRASEARDINNEFQVVGRSYWIDEPDQETHAFLWTQPTGMIDLGTLGGVESGATAISSDGKVVGYSQDVNGDYRAFLWTPDQPNGTTGTMIDLGSLGGKEVWASDVNAAGQVVGGSTLAGEAEGHAFVWTQATGMVDLGTLGGSYSFAIGINDAGVIVGEAQLGSGKRPFVWTPNAPNGTAGTMVPMLTLGGTQARGAAINNLQQITGSSSLDGDPPFAPFEEGIIPRSHAFVTPSGAGRAGQTITFGTLSNRTFTDADFTVSASASSGLAVSFAAGGTCTIDGATVHLISPGVCTITASQSGDSTYKAAPNVPQQFDIAKATQAVITLGAPASLTYGNTATLTASGGSGSGGIGFNAGASSGCGVAGNQLFVTNAAGRCSVTAFKLGDDFYVADLSSAATVTLNKASATLSLSNLTQAFTGTAKPVTVTTTPGGIGTVAVTYNGSANAPANAGSYAVVASLTSNNYQTANATGTLVITPPLKNVALNVAAIVGGVNAVGTVTLSAKAPAGGLPVALSSSNTAVATVPAVVTVPAGATTSQFPVTTAGVAAPSSAVISAMWGTTKTDSLTVNPAALSGVTVNPKTVAGGGSVTGTVTLTGVAPASGALVTLASSKSAAIVPANVTIPAGQTSATFTIATTQVAANVKPSISASYGGVTKTAPLTVAK